MRRTRAAGNAALACGLASWVLAGVAFVSSRTPAVQSFRGRVAAAAGGDIEPFRPISARPDEQATSHWTSVAGIAVAFALAVTLVATPVRAEEAAAPAVAEESAAPVAPKSRRKKGSRPKVPKEEKQESTAPKGPAVVVKQTEEGPQKVIISPSDELDDDERSLGATNLPVLFLLFFSD